MQIKDLIEILKVNNINMDACLINPKICPEGAICLQKDENVQGWRITYGEKGNFWINETFTAEHDACRFFFKNSSW